MLPAGFTPESLLGLTRCELRPTLSMLKPVPGNFRSLKIHRILSDVNLSVPHPGQGTALRSIFSNYFPCEKKLFPAFHIPLSSKPPGTSSCTCQNALTYPKFYYTERKRIDYISPPDAPVCMQPSDTCTPYEKNIRYTAFLHRKQLCLSNPLYTTTLQRHLIHRCRALDISDTLCSCHRIM